MLGKYSATVDYAYRANQNWFKLAPGSANYDVFGYDQYGYNEEGFDRAGYQEFDYREYIEGVENDLYYRVAPKWNEECLLTEAVD